MSISGRYISRRSFAAASIGALGLAAVGKSALAGAAQPPTPMQTMGPFYPIKRLAEADADLTMLEGHNTRALGDVIAISGRVFDRRGNPMSGAVIELWQANAAGRYAHANDPSTAPLDPNFQGFAMLKTSADGAYRITTVKPAAYPSPIGVRPAHIHFDVLGRDTRLVTQMYFPGDSELQAKDPIFREMGADASRTIAKLEGAGRYNWDIVIDDA
jgi:protocatechuate 3,4-dioxygenase beta subunit